jgi:trans-aconitate methyltransferase
MTVAKSEWANHFDNGKFRHPEFVTCDQYKQLILKTGYEGTVDRQDSWWRFENRSQLALWFEASIRPFMERLKNESPEVRKKFACEVIDNYMAKIASISDYPKLDGDEVFLRGPLIVVHASPKIYRDTAAITF